jgi:hypothetical protein
MSMNTRCKERSPEASRITPISSSMKTNSFSLDLTANTEFLSCRDRAPIFEIVFVQSQWRSGCRLQSNSYKPSSIYMAAESSIQVSQFIASFLPIMATQTDLIDLSSANVMWSLRPMNSSSVAEKDEHIERPKKIRLDSDL